MSTIDPPSYENLTQEVTDALALHYQTWLNEHGEEEIYAYVIYATPLISTLAISVLTEQRLQQVALDYKSNYEYDKQTLEQLVDELRWSVADTPYCGDYQEIFSAVNERLQDMMPFVDSLELDNELDNLEFNKHMETLYDSLVASLNEFSKQVLRDVQQPLLYVDFGDMSDEERLVFIKRCNDPDRVDWYSESIARSRSLSDER
jgi:hypothetical protein